MVGTAPARQARAEIAARVWKWGRAKSAVCVRNQILRYGLPCLKSRRDESVMGATLIRRGSIAHKRLFTFLRNFPEK